jgi:putative heme-binding domain-containing protein
VALRKAKRGWTIEDRKRYFSWFKGRSAGQDAGPTYPAGGNYFINASAKHPAEFEKWFTDVGIKAGNGASYNNFIKKLKTELIAGLNDIERAELGAMLIETPVVAKTPLKERQFVREWKMSDFADSLNGPSRARSYDSGREAFAAAQCFQCHRFANEGGAIGPDLSGAGSKYSRRDLLESILESSKVISDQYQNTTVTTKDDEDVTGRVVEDTDSKLVLVVNPLTGDKMDIKKSDVKGRAPSKTSPMPDGLVNILTKEEILDLIAYIESSGNKQHAAFKE